VRLVTVKMPEVYVRGIDELVKAGKYTSRSEVIRIAVRELLMRELWGANRIMEPVHAGPTLTGVKAPIAALDEDGVVDLL